jgi:hypothetical protein
MRLASFGAAEAGMETYIFDVRARMDGDNIAVLDPEVVPHDPIYPCRAVIEVVVGENDQDSVLPLLALYQDCVATEELERLHGVVGEGDDGVVIVDGIGDAGESQYTFHIQAFWNRGGWTYINEFGFFFFLRMAVAVSSSCGELAGVIFDIPAVIFTVLCSAPDGSL